MQTKNDTTKPEDSPQQEAGEGCSGATCSRLDGLLESLDAWIEDALKGSKPIGLTLSRARVTITDQRDRIGEIFDALECQNQEVERLRNAIRSFVSDYERISWGWDGDCGSKDLVDALFDSIPANAGVLAHADENLPNQ